jgi:Uma2 family endonuclease
MMAVLNRLLTAEDLLRMPQESIRSDLTRGELIRMTPAGARHGQIAGNFLIKLGAYVAGKRMGRVFAAETGFILSRDPDTVRGPDVAFVSRERITVNGNSRAPRPPPRITARISLSSGMGPPR